MQKTFIRFSATLMVATFLFSCQKEMSKSAKSDVSTATSSSNTVTIGSTCGQLRTYTQGGWGASPAGNNPGTYLHANFQGAFGDTLTVGCYPGKYYVKLTSAQAVTDLLPTGGPAAALTAVYTDPASIKNVLVGQLVALKLSVGFDYADANFGQSNVALGGMIIASGTFKGNTVADFLAIGEEVLGGCSKDFTPAQINETATAINENFDNGSTDKGFLTCPTGGGNPGGGGGNPQLAL
ncbi:hypothetical protein A4D02_32165 [Niastella koreensis]|uniref:Ig family protein n=2 Tax=Niastella koreensis TaxID=354356 RepID=G8TBW4_NIAKG|nr:hypothetical protein [Niastella koreensis]AEV99257.1 Ig family protein [Niastella koreensis GR20-10]OQP46047.1 hypothetical protein A4D02_32165 [Niastella koreensis]